MPLILVILIALPLLEIAVLVAVGSNIGVLATIGLVIFTGLLGSVLLKMQGASAFSRLQAQLKAGRSPDKELANAAMIMLAGVFLIIPGFVSDCLGLLLFLPPVRAFVIRSLAGRVSVVHPGDFHQDYRRDDGVVDLDENEFRRTDSPEARTSPWRRLPGEQD